MLLGHFIQIELNENLQIVADFFNLVVRHYSIGQLVSYTYYTCQCLTLLQWSYKCHAVQRWPGIIIHHNQKTMDTLLDSDPIPDPIADPLKPQLH